MSATFDAYRRHGFTCQNCPPEVASGRRLYARRSDPRTSHAVAGLAPEARGEVHAAILDLLELAPRTDDELYAAYIDGGHPRRTPQRLRTARSELVARGLVRDSGRVAPSAFGNAATVWAAVR